MRTAGRHLVSFVGSTVLVWVVSLLWASRPTTAAISTAVSRHESSELLNSVAWLGCLVLALGLLNWTLAVRTRRTPIAPRAIQHLRSPRQTARTRGLSSTRGYSDRAFPLIPSPRRPISIESAAEPESLPPQPTSTLGDHRARRSAQPTAAEISVLGPLTITGERKHGRRLRSATRELLAYLALHPNGAHRDQITDTLWPDQTPEQGRNRLWRAAADARNQLGETILLRDQDRYRLDRSQLRVDLDQLEDLLAQLGHDDASARSLPKLQQALSLFTGEPFAGTDMPWAENEQRRLQAVHLDLLERTGRALLASDEPANALAQAERGLAAEPYNEKLARVAMQAEAALGLRKAVIHRYEQLREVLEEQLGLEPHAETKRLYRQLLSQDELHQSSDAAGRSSTRQAGSLIESHQHGEEGRVPDPVR